MTKPFNRRIKFLMIKTLSTFFKKWWHKNVILLVYTTKFYDTLKQWKQTFTNNQDTSLAMSKTLWTTGILHAETTTKLRLWPQQWVQTAFLQRSLTCFCTPTACEDILAVPSYPWPWQNSMLRLFFSIMHIISLNTDSSFVCSHLLSPKNSSLISNIAIVIYEP